MARIKIIFIVILVLTHWSCSMSEDNVWLNGSQEKNYSAEQLSTQEYKQWFLTPNLPNEKKQIINEVEFSLKYLTPEYMTLQELKNDTFNKAQFDTIIKNYNSMSYFNFKIAIPSIHGELLKYNVLDKTDYNERLNYYAFEMGNDILLLQNNDTLKTGLYHFERTFELVPYLSFQFAFDNSKFNNKEPFTILFNDKIFEKGITKYHFKKNQLTNIPTLI